MLGVAALQKGSGQIAEDDDAGVGQVTAQALGCCRGRFIELGVRQFPQNGQREGIHPAGDMKRTQVCSAVGSA